MSKLSDFFAERGMEQIAMDNFRKAQQQNRLAQMTHEQSYSAEPYREGIEYTPEAWAYGIRSIPGNLANFLQDIGEYTTGRDYPNRLGNYMNELTQVNEMGYTPQTEYEAAIATIPELVYDPAILASAPYTAYKAARSAPRVANVLADEMGRTGMRNQIGALGVKDLPMDEVSRMQRAQAYPTNAFSGSTHDISAFRGDLANPESDWGRGTYASTSIDDVNANYAGVGPDLTGRINLEAERVADELAYDDPAYILEEYGIPLSRYEADEAGVAEEIARQRLVGEAGNGVVYPLKINTQKYAVVGGPDSTKLENPDYYDLARSELDAADYADEMDFEDAVSERAWELQADDPDSLTNRVYEALRDTDAYQYEDQLNAVMEEITESLTNGYLDIDDLDDAIRNNIVDAYDDAGELVSPGGISAQVLKNLGFEGVIDNKVDLKFGTGRRFGQQMEGVYPDTQHIITFPDYERNLRSRFAAFDPSKKDSADLLASKLLPIPAGLLGLGLYDDEPN